MRNYRINIKPQGVNIDAVEGEVADLIYRCAYGKVGFSIDRVLLTEALESYFGSPTLNSEDTPPVSASEQRLRKRLGVEVIDIFARAMLAGDTFGELTQHDNSYEEVAWEYVARFRYQSQNTGRASTIAIYLDADLVDVLIHRFAQPITNSGRGKPIDNLLHLPVQVDCVVASWQMPLAQILGLAPGDVVAVRPFDRYEVRINRQECFTGLICEAEGALYLTSLETVKSA
ncbi:FliM/FliN family flagellar motor switch protein [Alkalilimnicola ehrlichii]|nr:FliM/FliN family flagellar motor switch protein [Alkalilimnicola ehrlichii]